MNDLHQLGCAELFPNNETAVEIWSGQSSFHGSTCDGGAASSDLFQYYLRPHRLNTAGRRTCEIQALQVRSRACLPLHERVVLHMSWDNSVDTAWLLVLILETINCWISCCLPDLPTNQFWSEPTACVARHSLHLFTP